MAVMPTYSGMPRAENVKAPGWIVNSPVTLARPAVKSPSTVTYVASLGASRNAVPLAGA